MGPFHLRGEDDGHLVVRVTDHGAGFDPEEVMARQGGDPGLGLARIRQRLEHLGGRVERRRSPGDGTEVEIHAPISRAAG